MSAGVNRVNSASSLERGASSMSDGIFSLCMSGHSDKWRVISPCVSGHSDKWGQVESCSEQGTLRVNCHEHCHQRPVTFAQIFFINVLFAIITIGKLFMLMQRIKTKWKLTSTRKGLFCVLCYVVVMSLSLFCSRPLFCLQQSFVMIVRRCKK